MPLSSYPPRCCTRPSTESCEMGNRVKYPLTDAAKQNALSIAGLWQRNEIDQYFRLSYVQRESQSMTLYPSIRASQGIDVAHVFPSLGVVFELAKFGLIDIRSNIDPDDNAD